MDKNWTQLTQDNWTFCQYKSLKSKAFISLGAEPGQDILFFITCIDLKDDQELFQKTFINLKDALSEINRRYGHWHFEDLRQSEDQGCGSCSAH
jgi:hypothetical protein